MNEQTDTPAGRLESARGHIQAAMNDISRSLTLKLEGPGTTVGEIRRFYRCLKAAEKSMRHARELSRADQAPATDFKQKAYDELKSNLAAAEGS